MMMRRLDHAQPCMRWAVMYLLCDTMRERFAAMQHAGRHARLHGPFMPFHKAAPIMKGAIYIWRPRDTWRTGSCSAHAPQKTMNDTEA
jgi:hypothetical protein